MVTGVEGQQAHSDNDRTDSDVGLCVQRKGQSEVK